MTDITQDDIRQAISDAFQKRSTSVEAMTTAELKKATGQPLLKVRDELCRLIEAGEWERVQVYRTSPLNGMTKPNWGFRPKLPIITGPRLA